MCSFSTLMLLGLLTCKNRRPYNLYCVGGDVKPCSINQSINLTFDLVVKITSLFASVSSKIPIKYKLPTAFRY